MTHEELIAAAEALEWAYNTLPDGNDIYGAWTTAKDAIEARIKELRAQAEATPRIVREGRDFDVKFHDNGAAQGNATSESSRGLESHEAGRASGESSTALGRAEDPPSQASPAAAPPSATQPVAQVVCNPDGSDKRVIFHSHRALYETPLGTFLYAAPPSVAPPSVEPVAWNHACNALCTHIDLWIPQCPHCGKPRTAPPDLAARVKELEKLAHGAYDKIEQEMLRLQVLRGVGGYADPFVIWTHLNTIHNSLRAALAKGEE